MKPVMHVAGLSATPNKGGWPDFYVVKSHGDEIGVVVVGRECATISLNGGEYWTSPRAAQTPHRSADVETLAKALESIAAQGNDPTPNDRLYLDARGNDNPSAETLHLRVRHCIGAKYDWDGDPVVAEADVPRDEAVSAIREGTGVRVALMHAFSCRVCPSETTCDATDDECRAAYSAWVNALGVIA